MSAGNLTKLFCEEGLKTVEGDINLAADIATPVAATAKGQALVLAR